MLSIGDLSTIYTVYPVTKTIKKYEQLIKIDIDKLVTENKQLLFRSI